MDVDKFDQCVRYLSKNYNVLSIEEACGTPVRAGEKPLATISFDDGYRDNLEYAAPVLQKHRCPASFYIVTNCIDNGGMVWTQEIKHFFQNTGQLKLNSDLGYLPPQFRTTSWSNRQQRLSYARTIRDFLLVASLQVRQDFLKDMRESFCDVEPQNPMMNWDDVAELHSAGFIIGSHTRTHPVLPVLHDPSELEAELALSGARIKHMLGEFPVSIAYPFGAYDQRVTEAARRAGYRCGLTSNQQWYYSDRDDAFTISRTLLSNEPWIKLLSRMNGSFERLRKLVKGEQQHPWRSLLLASNGVTSSIGGSATGMLETLSC